MTMQKTDEMTEAQRQLYGFWQQAFCVGLAEGADPRDLCKAMLDIAMTNTEATFGPIVIFSQLVAAAEFFNQRIPAEERVANPSVRH
jgi:hypothetical protein